MPTQPELEYKFGVNINFFFIFQSKQIKHESSGKCLAITESKQRLLMEECRGEEDLNSGAALRQRWAFENYDPSKLWYREAAAAYNFALAYAAPFSAPHTLWLWINDLEIPSIDDQWLFIDILTFQCSYFTSSYIYIYYTYNTTDPSHYSFFEHTQRLRVKRLWHFYFYSKTLLHVYLLVEFKSTCKLFFKRIIVYILLWNTFSLL